MLIDFVAVVAQPELLCEEVKQVHLALINITLYFTEIFIIHIINPPGLGTLSIFYFCWLLVTRSSTLYLSRSSTLFLSSTLATLPLVAVVAAASQHGQLSHQKRGIKSAANLSCHSSLLHKRMHLHVVLYTHVAKL